MQNKRLFGKICYIHRQMCRENNSLFLDYGISPGQLYVLAFLHKKAAKGERVCQKDVEKEINLRPSSVSTLVSNLEKRAFITRVMYDGDARTKYIELTQHGKAICERDKILMGKCDEAVQSALSLEEQTQFDKLLEKIIKNIG